MLIHIALIVCCIFSVELIIQSNFMRNILSIKIISKKVLKILKSEKISDCWKEIIIPFYAFSMFKYSIKLFFILASLLCIFYLPCLLISDFIYFSISLYGVIESMIFCMTYLKIRNIVFWIRILPLKSCYIKLLYPHPF